MRTIVVLTVITLFALSTARCADAGVMLGESPKPAVQVGCGGMFSLGNPSLPQEETQADGIFQGLLSGISSNVSSSVSQSAAFSEIEVPVPQAIQFGTVTLSNAALPPSPILDGLLKPS